MLMMQLYKQFWNIETTQAILQFKTNIKIKAISVLLKLIRNKLKKILKLDVNKVSHNSDIPVKGLKENSDIFSNFLCNSLNNFIKLSTFSEILKHTDITPFYRKGKKDIKGNYRPVSVLPNLSNIFEKRMFEQMSQVLRIYFQNINLGFGRVLVPSNVFWQC